MSNKPIDLSKDKIRYLAIGDSISEGYNSLYGIGFPGSAKNNNESDKLEISGMSFPAILSQMIDKLSPGCVESFENFSITGSRVVDWLYFLGVEPQKYNYLNSIKQINSAQEADVKENNPQKNRSHKQFGMFGVNDENDFDKLKKSIKKANFITITIGANDWLSDFPFFEIMSVKKGILSREEFDKKIIKSNKQLLKQIKQLFSAIKNINPNVNIVSTNYTTSLSLLSRLANEQLNKGDNKGKNAITVLNYISLLNEVVMQASLESGVCFINYENKIFWEQNIDNLSKVFFDLHPTYFGYKKIAQEIFAKTVLSDNFYQKSLKEIKVFFPDMNKEFYESDYHRFSNIFDFSKLNLTDGEIIKSSKITNTKSFWSDNSHEKQFLNLKRKLTVKKYFVNDINDISNNVKSVLNACMLLIEKNNLDSNNYIKDIVENKSYYSAILIAFSKSEYIDIVVNQIQIEINNNNRKGVKLTLNIFKDIIFDKLFNVPNLLLLLQDFSGEIMKKSNYEFLHLFENAIISLLLDIDKSKKYKDVIKKYIKTKTIDTFTKRFKSTQPNLTEALIDNFVDTKLEFIIINLIKSYFKSLKEMKNIKNINVFLTKYIKDFFKKINLKSLIEGVIDNEKIKYIFSETIMNILEIKNYTIEDILLFKNFLKLLILKIDDNDLVINFFSELVIKFISTHSKPNDTIYFDVFWSFKGREFWNILKTSKIKKIWTNKNDVFVISDVINLMFEKSLIMDSEFYKILMNVQNPKLKDNSKSSNLFNVAKDLVEKIFKIENIYLAFSNTLYNAFLEFKKLNPNISNENNPYYKSFYRFTISSLWICYRLFQKDISFNIFSNTKKGILKSIPSIASHIHKLSVGNNSNIERAKLVDYIFGSESESWIATVTEDNYLIDDILWYIRTCDSDPKDKYSKKDKKTIIFESLQKGYWNID